LLKFILDEKKNYAITNGRFVAATFEKFQGEFLQMTLCFITLKSI